MSKLILLTGDIAAGKSTFSKKLSERFNIEVYNKDNVKELLADTIGFADREENLKLSRAAVQMMIMIYQKHSDLGKDLILEANFHRDELERIFEIARANNDEVIALLFKADIDVLYERFRHRVEYENRHPAHQTAGLNTIEAFEKYILESRQEISLSDCIEVDANDFSYQDDSVLLKLIEDKMLK